MLMRSVILIRTMGLLLPLLAACALWLWRLPSRRTRAGILLAFAWNLSALLAINLLAAHFGWWRFYAQGGLLLGIPADLYIGWAVLWGAIPVLAFPRMRLLFLIALMLGVDLLLMPACAPVIQLGNRWLVGEAMALVIVLLPAQALARWTETDSRSPASRYIGADGRKLADILESYVLAQEHLPATADDSRNLGLNGVAGIC